MYIWSMCVNSFRALVIGGKGVAPTKRKAGPPVRVVVLEVMTQVWTTHMDEKYKVMMTQGWKTGG